MKIYLASSWRNQYQIEVLAALRAAGLEVYDFKHPAPGNNGFGWKQCDPDLEADLTVDRMRRVLAHPAANAGFQHDFKAMQWADVCVLLLPSGMSAHLEAGWFAGACKPVLVLAPEIREPELMYKCFDVEGVTPMYATVGEVIAALDLFALPVEYLPRLRHARVSRLENALSEALDIAEWEISESRAKPGHLARLTGLRALLAEERTAAAPTAIDPSTASIE